MSAATVATRNAANAEHSTGPVTAEGKARSSRNALRHGLTGNTVVLAHESAEEYETVRQSFFDTNRPATEREEQLVIRMADCWWRLARALRVESEFLQQRADAISEANPDLTGESALAAMFMDPAQSKGYRLFLRYLTNAQNTYRQVCAEFEKVRKEREAAENEECMLEALYASSESVAPDEPLADTSETCGPATGFVSHPDLAAAAVGPLACPSEGRLAA